MIPKIIHYCWLGGNPMPERLKRWQESWRRMLPDFEFILWNESNFDINSVPWVKEAYEAGMYAFAADYIRYYALYTYGGIYMDTDVEVVRPFAELLERPYLMGAEYDDYPESGIFGAIPHSDLMRWCMEFYHDRHFSPDQITLNTCKAPQVMHQAIGAHCRFLLTESFIPDEAIVCLLPSDYLTAMSADTGIAHPTANTRTIHHFAGSWCYPTFGSRLRRWLKVSLSKILGETLVRRVRNILIKN